ncbi:MAG: ATP-binding cassette domain-containing protein, partial [Bacilli bacterium]
MIEAKNVSKTYNPGSRKENCVLNNASLSLPDTGMVFIVGKSGIGKSTILNAIGGLISYEGEILYNGKKEDIEKYRRRNIGYIFQSFYLFEELSVRDNIRIGLNLAGVYDEKEITRRVGILLAAVGLNINASRSAGALSLGQRQRVAIARALASNPHIILADEPTGNLDSKNSLRIMDILKNLSKDHLVLCVTHNVNLVHLYADKAFSVENK